MSMPLSKLDLLTGYRLAFAAVGVAQALIAAVVAFGPLGLDVAGSPALIVALAVGNAIAPPHRLSRSPAARFATLPGWA